MTIHTFKRTQIFQLPIGDVFKFFESPENLAIITPGWLDFRMLTPPPVIMKAGVSIEYRIRWNTFSMRWTSLITEYQPPHRFVDVQTRGPYSFWQHTHSFMEKDGWTEMTDEVQYALPFGVLGNFMHRLIVRHQLDQIFKYRSQIIGTLLQQSSVQSINMEIPT
ncbi:MAG: SRPBCC family protein [Bacteroidota bacterium]